MSGKKLNKLLVRELKEELEERDIPTDGNKQQLFNRLNKALIDEGMDPESHVFTTEIRQLRNEVKEFHLTLRSEIEDIKKSFKGTIEKAKIEINEEVDMRILINNEKYNEEISGIREELNKARGSQVVTQTTLSKIRPPIFDGTISWSVYKRQFEAAVNVNGWTRDEDKATALVLALRGKAAELLHTISDPGRYDAVVRALELRFGDEHLQEVYRGQLKTRQQKYGEPLREIEADIERLARLSTPTKSGHVTGLHASSSSLVFTHLSR
ncbi:hypothetical protein Btru_054422 [Bulinus truncatus]|nr:hypothetical protein Btru_054422 [Bulinus truncatus]